MLLGRGNTPRRDLVGHQFGRLQVARLGRVVVQQKRRRIFWKCACVCGVEKEVEENALLCGRTTSCGCRKLEMAKALRRTHGRVGSLEHRSWGSMIQRCTNPKNPSYKHYGGRGIKICDRWRKFENFLIDMGCRTEGTTLDRRDTNGDYTPENCRWATRLEQGRNSRRNHLLTLGSETHPISVWAEKTGLSARSIEFRITRSGWPVDVALTTSTEALIHMAAVNNKRSRRLTFEGKTFCAAEWARETGISPSTLHWRLRSGWSLEEVLQKSKRRSRGTMITFKNRIACIRDWEAELEMKPSTLVKRLAKGWSVDRALTEPVAKRTRRRK